MELRSIITLHYLGVSRFTVVHSLPRCTPTCTSQILRRLDVSVYGLTEVVELVLYFPGASYLFQVTRECGYVNCHLNAINVNKTRSSNTGMISDGSDREHQNHYDGFCVVGS